MPAFAMLRPCVGHCFAFDPFVALGVLYTYLFSGPPDALLHWPANSPDLNPVENMRRLMKQVPSNAALGGGGGHNSGEGVG